MASIIAPTSIADPAPDENTDPLAVENSAYSSPQKRVRPAASSLRSPLVRERFLRETTMSATPQPQTPTGGYRMVVRVRSNQLPANLEVGKNTFRPPMNCSSSRISPKKDAIGIRDSTAESTKEVTTPTKTLSASPLKMLISTKPSPAEATVSTPPKATAPKHEFRTGSPTKKPSSLSRNRSSRNQGSDKSSFETSLKKGRPETPNHERPCSPVKRTIELDSPSSSVDMSPDLARNLVSHPNHLLRMLSGCLADATMDDDSAVIPVRRAIPNPSEYFTPIKKTRKPVNLQPKNIDDITANLGSNNNSSAFDWPFSPGVERNLASPTPTPLRKASEKLQLVGSGSYEMISEDGAPCAPDVAARLSFEKELSSILPLQGLEQIVNMSSEVQSTQLLSESRMGCFAEKTQESQTSQYASSYCPSTKRQRDTRADSGKQIEWNDADKDTSEASETQTDSWDEHIETSLSISLELEKDVDNAKTTSSSIPTPALCEPVNLSELLPMPNSDSTSDRQDMSGSGTMAKSTTVKKFNYNMSSLPRIKTNSPTKVASTKLPSKSTIPRCQSSGYISAKTKENRPITTESPNLKSANLNKTKGPASTISHEPIKSITTPIKTASTLPRLTRTSTKQPSTRLPVTSPWKLESPFATPPPPKRPLSLHIPPKLASIPTLKQKPSTPKAPRPLSLVSPRKTPLPSTRPDTTASATLPRRSPTKLPKAEPTTCAPKKVHAQQESTTPSTTPPALLLPPTAPTPPPIPTLPSALPAPPTHLPRAPPPPPPPRRRHRRPAALFIPVPPPAADPTSTYLAPQDIDRNALRTPSKTILHSLDKAIDEKIAEDAARGVVVTAGGNRVRDLLEARKGRRV
ncbi:hypothetical protein COCHEDRAFT_1218605 [Bipolaris maydis C5]|uniref:Uncharacterized protein n=1 Tax=Cochliobolus heterostrophus (strain C5 / ATCC 48332 / race O) TaxID=701091 RepID=M2TIR5_COCH5|nr:hypothetical protein COCHEDRAFT_1218605 [Bipolaris maydis C5]KAH7551819.1 hypothetical protein BM1_09453 [Bipolaris maydis]KAJ5064950.1 hypothetical protein J3E74DRAFT_285441 [Bipolaris maydis]KAJ6214013.1 hypothetical protein PSV09DRAFT_1218605 [Bipolaris maydis]KAJ6275213.1 hypothetical protein PSV08DRAFT_368591 [Bipolaris maydis]